jgi:antitoxin component of MazEF toxin-antitoxin module
VVTIPHEIVKELSLRDGDSVWFSVDGSALTLDIVKLQPPPLKKEDGREETT